MDDWQTVEKAVICAKLHIITWMKVWWVSEEEETRESDGKSSKTISQRGKMQEDKQRQRLEGQIDPMAKWMDSKKDPKGKRSRTEEHHGTKMCLTA